MQPFPCVIQVFASLFTVKTLCENCKNVCDFGCLAAYTSVSMCYSSDFQLVSGENVVWKRQKCMRFRRFHDVVRRVHSWFPVFWLPRWRICNMETAVSWCVAVYVVEFAAVSWCNTAVSMCYSSVCEIVCGENVVRKWWFGLWISAVGGVISGFS